MRWYAAHIVMYAKFTIQKNEKQEKFPLWENILLIKATSDDEAYEKACRKGKDAAKSDKHFKWAGRPAKWIFGGVRKMVLCEDAEDQPTDGTEITYTEMEVTKRNLDRFMRNKPTEVAFI